jgi:hypothetical protein
MVTKARGRSKTTRVAALVIRLSTTDPILEIRVLKV